MSNFKKWDLTHEIFRILLVFSQFLWNLSTLVKKNKNQLCHDTTTEPAQYCDAKIPAGIFPSNHAYWAARWMNQARSMHTASNFYTKLAAPGWPFSCNTGIKVTSAELNPVLLMCLGPYCEFSSVQFSSVYLAKINYRTRIHIRIESWQGSPEETRRLIKPGLPSHREISKVMQ